MHTLHTVALLLSVNFGGEPEPIDAARSMIEECDGCAPMRAVVCLVRPAKRAQSSLNSLSHGSDSHEGLPQSHVKQKHEPVGVRLNQPAGKPAGFNRRGLSHQYRGTQYKSATHFR